MSALPILGLIGAKRVGKDAFARTLTEHRGYARVAFADPLREAALRLDPIVDWDYGCDGYLGTACECDNDAGPVRLSTIVERHGWEDAKDRYPEVRRTLERLGTDAIRTIAPTFWIGASILELTERTTPVVVTDVRYPNEADTIRELGGKLVRITRPGAIRSDHIADNSLDDYEADYSVLNDGTLDDLARHAQRINLAIA